MREMYHNEADRSPTSPDMSPTSMTCSDAFYDRFPWFRLVGRFNFNLNVVAVFITLLLNKSVLLNYKQMQIGLLVSVFHLMQGMLSKLSGKGGDGCLSGCCTPTFLK